MKKLFIMFMCLFAMLAAGKSLRAQEVSIVLTPGWNWISYPSTDTLDFATALGDFTPMQGDVIKSLWGNAVYREDGRWWGSISQFYPGYGYKYFSNRQTPVTVTFNAQQVVVTTAEPTDITMNSATNCGNVVSVNGDDVLVLLKGICWGMNPNPSVEDNYVEAGSGLGNVMVSLTGLACATTYYVRTFAVISSGIIYGNEVSFVTSTCDYVDLGLPSGLLWATCNLGSDSPEDYGDYYAWGETQTKALYSWGTYQYCNGDTWDDLQLTKYCGNSDFGYNGYTDNLSTLLPEDDAAVANLGDGWRMPSSEDWQELLNNTTCIWTTQNGVNGRLFTASNGNSLFLPAAGIKSGSVVYYPGSEGYYWSSSLYTSNPGYSWGVSIQVNDYGEFGVSRYCGRSIRPVFISQPSASYSVTVALNPVEGGTAIGGGTYEEGQSCTVQATANEGYTFTNWTENGSVVSTDATYTFIVNADRSLVANFTFDSGSHAYIDLGLPSGTLWATCNLGADAPEDYGDYFAWGETQPKDYYDWSTYQYSNGDYNSLTKYCYYPIYGYNYFNDNLNVLLPDDDAATANLGSDWRMPTMEEWEELTNYTTYTRTTRNGVTGILFTATNGNSLFLPAAGYRQGSELNNDECCYYWSSSLCLCMEGPDIARNLFAYSECSVEIKDRICGNSIRPVRCKSSVINVNVNSAEGGSISGSGTYMDNTNCTLTSIANQGYTFIGWTENGKMLTTEAVYSFNVNGNRNIVANFVSQGVHSFVDLDLPSGTLWATCNVGANAPEEYGDYFAWGEILPKNTYYWDNYWHGNMYYIDEYDEYGYFTKYNTLSNFGYSDNLTTLLPEDDAASANWGTDWRMPTQAECQELYDNTTATWTTQNGIQGMLFTSENGNSIFLPITGIRDNELGSSGNGGHYWSSSLNASSPVKAWDFVFGSANYEMDSYYRNAGQSVRPVRSFVQN